MSKLQSILTLSMLAFALSGAWAQDTSTPPASTEPVPQSGQQEPIPAYGQDNAPPPISENPPLSGLDLPSLEPHAAPLSYIQPGATFSESAERQGMIAEAGYLRPKCADSIAPNDIEHLLPSPSTPKTIWLIW